MTFILLFHGALGPWDEIIALIPVVIGAVLLLYLYFTSRGQPPASDDAEGDPSAGPEVPADPLQ